MSLLSIRTALVLLIAAVLGAGAFVLSFAASSGNVAGAALVGFGAAGASLATINNLLDKEDGGSGRDGT